MLNKRLIEDAKTAFGRAYARYSQFAVGAALLSESGEVSSGCNVENRSYGLTMCAERVALGAAIVKGERAFKELVIFTDATEPTVPCGACRQVLAEFCPNLKITSVTLGGHSAQFSHERLFPLPAQGILRQRST